MFYLTRDIQSQRQMIIVPIIIISNCHIDFDGSGGFVRVCVCVWSFSLICWISLDLTFHRITNEIFPLFSNKWTHLRLIHNSTWSLPFIHCQVYCQLRTNCIGTCIIYIYSTQAIIESTLHIPINTWNTMNNVQHQKSVAVQNVHIKSALLWVFYTEWRRWREEKKRRKKMVWNIFPTHKSQYPIPTQ